MKHISWLLIVSLAAVCGCNKSVAVTTKSGSEQPSAAVVPEPMVTADHAANDASVPSETVEPPTEPVSTADATNAAGSPSPEVSVQILNWQQTQELIAEQQGKVVVLDLWSTSCPPCMKEFPNLVALQHRFGDRIACISLNCDYLGIAGKPPEYYRPQVLDFLLSRQATIQNVMSNVAADELFDQLELPSIPAVYVYDRGGTLVQRFDHGGDFGDEGFTYDAHIRPLVEQLLSELPAE